MIRPAFIAAVQATSAVTALLDHSDNGQGFGDEPVVELLAEALSLAIEVRLPMLEDCDVEYRVALTSLQARCAEFIEGWAG